MSQLFLQKNDHFKSDWRMSLLLALLLLSPLLIASASAHSQFSPCETTIQNQASTHNQAKHYDQTETVLRENCPPSPISSPISSSAPSSASPSSSHCEPELQPSSWTIPKITELSPQEIKALSKEEIIQIMTTVLHQAYPSMSFSEIEKVFHELLDDEEKAPTQFFLPSGLATVRPGMFLQKAMQLFNAEQKEALLFKVIRYMLPIPEAWFQIKAADRQIPSLIPSLVKYMLPDMIGKLAAKHIKKISVETIGILNLEQQMAWSAEQIKHFTPKQLGALSTEWFKRSEAALHISRQQITGLNNEQIDALLSAQGDRLDPSHLKNLKIQRVRNISSKELGELTEEEIAGMLPEEISTLSEEQAAWFSIEQISAFTEEQVPNIPVEWVWMLNPSQFKALTQRQIHGLTPEIIKALSSEHISSLRAEHISAFSAPQTEAVILFFVVFLEPHQARAFSLKSLRHISPEARQKLLSTYETRGQTGGQTEGQTGDRTEGEPFLSSEQVESLIQGSEDAKPPGWSRHSSEGAGPLQQEDSPSREQAPKDIASLSIEEMQALSDRELLQALSSYKKIKLLNPLHISALRPSVLNAFTEKQIRALSEEQLQAITEKQIQELDPEWISFLLPWQLSCFKASRLEAFSLLQVRALRQEQLQAIKLEVLRVLSPSWIGKLSLKQFNCLTELQVSVLSFEQLVESDKLPHLSHEQIGAISQELIWILEPKQIPYLLHEQIAKLKSEHIRDLSPEQVKAFSLKQMGFFDSEQIEALIEHHLENLNKEQLMAFSLEALRQISASASMRLRDRLMSL